MIQNTPPRPILAIHGTASSGAQWASLAAIIGPRRQVIAPDVPSADAPCRQAFFADVIDHLEGSVDLVAHSFGSAIAMHLAHARPDKINSVTLYDPVLPVRIRGELRLVQDIVRLGVIIDRSSPDEAMAAFLDYWMRPGAWDSLSHARKDALRAQHANVLRDFAQIRAGDWNTSEVTYTGPLTIITGGRSPRAIDQIAQSMARARPDARLIALPDLGHMAPVIQPAAVDVVFRSCLLRASTPRDLRQPQELWSGRCRQIPTYPPCDPQVRRARAA